MSNNGFPKLKIIGGNAFLDGHQLRCVSSISVHPIELNGKDESIIEVTFTMDVDGKSFVYTGKDADITPSDLSLLELRKKGCVVTG